MSTIRQLLTREFIHKWLYAVDQGYFAHVEPRIFTPKLDFNKMANQAEYLQALDTTYKSEGERWVTPVELFQVS